MGMVFGVCGRMLEINQMKLPIEYTEADMKNKIIKELKLRHIFKNMGQNTVFAGVFPRIQLAEWIVLGYYNIR